MRKLNKILIIDDDEISNFIFVETLQKLAVTETYRFFNNGKDALKYIAGVFSNISLGNLPPDLIFLDYRMPIMDGKEFIEELQRLNLQDFHWYNIILITSAINGKDNEYFLNLGVKGILEKPITDEKILNVVSRTKQIDYLKI